MTKAYKGICSLRSQFPCPCLLAVRGDIDIVDSIKASEMSKMNFMDRQTESAQ